MYEVMLSLSEKFPFKTCSSKIGVLAVMRPLGSMMALMPVFAARRIYLSVSTARKT